MFAKWFAAGTLVLCWAFAARPVAAQYQTDPPPTAPGRAGQSFAVASIRLAIRPPGVRRPRCRTTRPATASRSDRSRLWATGRLPT